MASRSPTPDPQPITLEEAIHDSHPERLVETLIAVCEKSGEAKSIVEQLLLTEIKPETIKGASNKEELKGKKRKRYEACEACHEEFDVEHNDDKDCQYHEGDLERIEDHPFWKEGKVDPNVDEEEVAEHVPEAVRWTCCKGQGDTDGCKAGKHRILSPEKAAKLAELWDDDGSEDED